MSAQAEDSHAMPRAFDGLYPHDAYPWTVENDDATYVSWRGIFDGDGKTVALVVTDEPGDDEFDAVTSLLCAAPELLEALLAVNLARHTDAPADWQRATDLSDAAIAKARGDVA